MLGSDDLWRLSLLAPFASDLLWKPASAGTAGVFAAGVFEAGVFEP